VIRDQTGNLLQAKTDALVNTVNTVGVMGKGIALQFKRAFPANYKAYKRACDQGQVELGQMFVWDAGALAQVQPRFVINFPTKKHWRSKSRLSDIETGLTELVRVIGDLSIQSIALPPLGCGLGGLDWSDVRPMIVAAFTDIPEVEVLLFGPDGAPTPATQPIRTDRPKMTPGRAALVAVMDRYLPFAIDITTVDIQKLMYFMQEAGEPLRLNYVKGQYGPYADNLRHVLTSMEGHHIEGMGDGSSRALDVIPFRLLPGAVAESEELLSTLHETRDRTARVADLIEGYESTYGLELLATVHWAATRGAHGELAPSIHSDGEVERAVRSWNDRKGKLFTTKHVEVALERLRSKGWLVAPAPVGLFE